jgi:hypothetical protein
MATAPINTALAKLLRRAEDEDLERLAETFVDVGPLFARLSTRDNQVIFGRRGTGKTHALAYLAERLRSNGDTVVSVDLRLIGSNGGVYSEAGVSLAEAATRLLLDVLGRIHEDLVDHVLEHADENNGVTAATLPLLDKLADAITEVSVEGETEQRDRRGLADASGSSDGLEIGLTPAGPALRAIAETNHYRRTVRERETLLRGVARHRVHFGQLGSVLQKLVPVVPGKRVWLLLDEWSSVPFALQPLLADLLRRSVLPIRGLTTKIAAIDHRSIFKVDRDDVSYLGFEVGSDVAADVDLDDYMVFSNDDATAVSFFAQLFTRHVMALSDEVAMPELVSSDEFIKRAFASKKAFAELVRAGEGVPRDAINILGKAALKADERRIALADVRGSARSWYLQDKEGAVKSKKDGLALLHWIIDEVIGHRRARAFLLRQGGENHLIQWLYDQRVVHLVKRGIAAKDRPGVRYDAYALDYGCYVDLLATSEAPRGLIVTDDEKSHDVPADEYGDTIRGAILDLASFEAREEARRPAELTPVRAEIIVKSTSMTLLQLREEDDDPLTLIEDAGWYLLTEVSGRVAAIGVGHRALRIGSSNQSHIRVRNSDLLAKHAVLSKAEPHVVISNAERTPVYVNGRRTRNRQLGDRDVVRIGEIEFVIVQKLSDAPETTNATPVDSGGHST